MVSPALVVIWVACGLLGGAGRYAASQRQFPEIASHGLYGFWLLAFGVSLIAGPGALIATLAIDRFRYGLKWLPTLEEGQS